MLKPQDIVILLKILSLDSTESNQQANFLSQNRIATVLCMSASEVHAGMKRLVLSGLLGPILNTNQKNKIIYLPIKAACEECLISAVKYFFPVTLGTYTIGLPTSYGATLFQKHIILGDDPVPVWPHALGTHRGLALEPLYRSVPDSLIQFPDPIFYELLALVDTLRHGRARERNIAIKLLRSTIHEGQKFKSNLKS